jgi:tripartite-type tricarboxylate transporter receptor subunit TctC
MDAAGRATRGDASPDTASPPAAAPSAQRRRALRTVAAGAAAIAGAPAIAIAQDDRSTVRLLVGAASAMDFTARLLGEYLREALGRPVVVESKLGAGGRAAR